MGDTRTVLASLQDERDSAAVYDALAQIEERRELADVYRRLAAVERRHAEAWRARLREAGVPEPPDRPTLRTRALIWLARRFGAGSVLPSLTSLEQIHGHAYAQGPGDAQARMAGDERSHARILRRLTATTTGLEGIAIAQLEGRHRTSGGNALRAAVYRLRRYLRKEYPQAGEVLRAALDPRAAPCTS